MQAYIQEHFLLSLLKSFVSSKEFRLLTDDFRKEEVGQTGGAETKPLVRQPLFAEDLLDDGVVD